MDATSIRINLWRNYGADDVTGIEDAREKISDEFDSLLGELLVTHRWEREDIRVSEADDGCIFVDAYFVGILDPDGREQLSLDVETG